MSEPRDPPIPPHATGHEVNAEEMETWEEFLERLKTLRDRKDAQLRYRGQGDASWTLETTLEHRGGQREMLLSEYYRMVLVRVRPHVESFTNQRWERPSYEGLQNWFSEGYDVISRALSKGELPAQEYLLYLRHHGFPSPLLDWSRSPFVGAYFAFIAPPAKAVPRRAIYVWRKPDVWSGGSDVPEMHTIGRYVRTHQRHFLQQSEYTYAIRYDQALNQCRFVPQEGALLAPVSPPHCLWKFTLPTSERTKVLRFLNSCNITPHSLFGTDDSLLHTLTVREFDIEDRRD